MDIFRPARFLAAFITCSALLSCVLSCRDKPTRPEELPPLDAACPGMKVVSAKGQVTYVGSSSSLAAADERPRTRCSFSYDFQMDTTEITIGQYVSIMNRLPAPYASAASVDSSEPVCNLTWYDAVLFCNQRSKQAGFDTVYRYDRIDSTSDGQAYELANFSEKLAGNGFRLPTEAEWEFAARAGCASDFPWGDTADSEAAGWVGWYDMNSGGSIHRVAQKRSNSFSLFDMLGNALEWVNDTKDFFPGQDVADFAGAARSASAVRPVKGGSYKHSVGRMRYAARGDIYDILASTSTPYVGFRCVTGAVSSPFWYRGAGSNPSTNACLILEKNLQTLLGRRCKIGFVNVTGASRTLCVADYSGYYPRVHEYLDRKDCYLPSLSPDGRWVSYCSANFGGSAESYLYLRETDPSGSNLVVLPEHPAFGPKWWVDTASNDTFLIYATSGMDNEDTRWEGTMTKRIRFAGGRFSGEGEVIENRGGYHGGLSAGGTYLSTGFTLLKMKNMNSDETKVLFTGPGNGKPAGDVSQVCNVSISPSPVAEDRVLHLDFGYSKTSSLVGASYRIHQVLFMTDFSNRVVRWYWAPAGHVWDHSRWSNDPGYAVATGETDAFMHDVLYVLNLEDSSSITAITGTDLWQPSLWLDSKGAAVPQQGFSLDSLGEYNTPPATLERYEFNYKMHVYWRRSQDIEIAFLGNSLVYCDVDCANIRRYRALNLGFVNCGITATVNIVNQYIIPNSPRIRMIAINVPFYFFGVPKGDGDPWESSIASSKGYLYDKSHGFWKTADKSQLVGIFNEKPLPEMAATWDSLGMAIFPCDGWGSTPPPFESGLVGWTIQDPDFIENWSIFKAFADTLANHQIHFLSIVFPESPGYKNTTAMFRGGPDWTTGLQIMDSLRQFESTHPYFHLYDAYLDGNHDYVFEDFYNSNHLCPAGAAKMAARLDSLIYSILQ